MKTVVTFDAMLETEWTMEVDIPAGWRRVWHGVVLVGDRYLHGREAKSGRVVWREITDPRQCASDQAECYWLLIRWGAPVDEACERCEKEPRVVGERYCRDCRRVVIQEIRRRGRA